MATEQNAEQELKKITTVLMSTAELAKHASLTGALGGGERRCILQYNTILTRLQEIDAAPERLFTPLDEEASFGEIGVACSQLGSYLESGSDIVGLLSRSADLVEHASLTGSLEDLETWCVPQYNRIQSWLEETGGVPEGLFPPLDEEASLGEVGVAYSQLASYLQTESDEVEDVGKSNRRRHRQRNRHRRQMKRRMRGIRGESDLKDLGELIREAMPDFVKEALKEAEKAESSEGKPDLPAVQEAETSEDDSDGLESQIAELGEQMQSLAEQLRRNQLPSDEIQRLADQMQKLGEQQARLVSQHTRLQAVD